MEILKNQAINAVRQGLHRVGIELIKTSRRAEETDLMAGLLAEAAAAERSARGLEKAKPGATGIIFSFNRPMQLELLLRSYAKFAENPAPLVVQYGAKGLGFEQAYEEVAKLYPQVTFVREGKFRDSLQAVLAAIKTPNLFFLVDDIVFVRPIDMAEFGALNPLTHIPTLRMAPTITHSYTMNQSQPAPSFREGPDDMLAFNWNESRNEWAYPMSVDGNLFDTAEITVMSRIAPYKAPNSYEGALMRFAPIFARRPGLCFALPKIINNPCNIVQTEISNRAGDVTPEALLGHWNSAERLALEPNLQVANTAPHIEVELVFEPRPGASKPKPEAKPEAKPAPKAKPQPKAKPSKAAAKPKS